MRPNANAISPMTASSLAPRSLPQAVTGADRGKPGLLRDRVSIRAMTDNDGALLRSFFRCLSPLARYRRFMSPMRDVPDYLFQHLFCIDQSSHVAYLAETIVNGRPVMIAEARYVVEQHCDRSCDFAIAVADTWQGLWGSGRSFSAALSGTRFDQGVNRSRVIRCQITRR